MSGPAVARDPKAAAHQKTHATAAKTKEADRAKLAEEKILLLQNRKREIIQSTISGDEEFADTLNWDEIQELLA